MFHLPSVLFLEKGSKLNLHDLLVYVDKTTEKVDLERSWVKDFYINFMIPTTSGAADS